MYNENFNLPLNAIANPPHPDFHNYDGEYFRVIGHGHISSDMYFYLRTKQPPNTIIYENVDGLKAMEALCSYYGVGMLHGVKLKTVNLSKRKWTDDFMIVQVSPDIVLYFYTDCDIFKVMYTDRVIREELQAIESIVKDYTKEKSNHKLNLLIFDNEMNSFRLNEFKLSESEADIAMHYNDDFAPINTLITQRLSQEKSKGIVLLHGNPGTGKTSYIRHLIRNIDKKLIYIPSNLASRLGDPEFLPFLVQQSGSVLIIEDAEDILQERSAGDNGTIANLLNLGDGLLSDCLNIQIICTFNAPLTRIDKALLRKGRVIASYEFKPLSVDKSNHLLKSLGSDIVTTKELTLAEVFYQKDMDFLKSDAKGIGFGK